MNRTSSNTRVSINLGTGKHCVERPPSLSHLSDEHLEGLRIAANEEYGNRQEERRSELILHTRNVIADKRSDTADYDGMLGTTDNRE